MTASFYNDAFLTVELSSDSQTVDFTLTPKTQVTITGHIAASHNPDFSLQNVRVSAVGYTTDMAKTDLSGDFQMSNIFGISAYVITFQLYGYADTTITIGVTDQAIDLGTILMRQEFLSPFDVYATLQNNKVTIAWKDGLKSEPLLLQMDYNECPESYTNEPNENVWLGNVFRLSDTTTITAVEIHTDVYDLSEGVVTIDVYDHNQDLLITSLPFAIKNDSVMIIDIPNIVVYDDIYAMLHFEGLSESVHALCFDNSDDNIINSAVIKYPDENIQLVSKYFGTNDANFAFHVRVHTLDPGNPETSGELSVYNIYRGLSEEFPNTTNWALINQEPVEQLWFVDSTWTPDDIPGEYRYVVEASYTAGSSEGTFSNEITWDGITALTDPAAFEGRLNVYPNPAQEMINVEVELEVPSEMILSIYTVDGQLVDKHQVSRQNHIKISRLTDQLPEGTYFLHLRVNDQATVKPFVVIKK